MSECYKCKKVSMLLFTCHCGKCFCLRHKNSEKHNCDYDFKKEAHNKASKNKIDLTNKFNRI